MLDLWNWAVADPLLMGFAPWHYGDEPSYGSVMGVGMRDMPETLSVYTELGMRMRQHLGAQFKSDDGYPISATFQLLTCDAQRGRQLFNLSNPDGWLAFRTGCAACDPDAGNCIDCMGCQVGAIPHIWYCPAAGSGPGAASWKRNRGANCSGGACPAGAMQLQTTQSASCFGAGDLTYGATVFLQKCNGSDTRQLWSYDSSTGLVSSFGNSSFCLDGGTPLNVSCASAPLSTKPYCNTTLAPAARAKDLVSRMAPYEKVQNMVSSNPGVKRLGVPPFAFSEALHGVASGCAATAYFPELQSNNTGCPTSFPHALALGEPNAFFGLGRNRRLERLRTKRWAAGHTFNASLWHRIGEVISTEARSLNNQEAAAGHAITGVALWTPDINLFRDPRWGRGQEVPGEDPTLNAHYAMNYVRGVQEDAAHPGRLKAVSTGKHFMDCECSWLSADRSRLNPWAVAARRRLRELSSAG